MTTYVALLRAVNLGKTRKVPMAELRALAEGMGLEHVRTLLQSGNLVFDSDCEGCDVVERLEMALLDRFGFAVPVILRTAGELESAAQAHPFGAGEEDPTRLHVVFYVAEPPPEAIERVAQREAGPERVTVRGREAYVHYPDGAGRSRLNLDPLGPGTARNWRTVRALSEMVGPGA
jgi:uncharacterized protein (DUF1697 family)